jgi:hypothetical protein
MKVHFPDAARKSSPAFPVFISISLGGNIMKTVKISLNSIDKVKSFVNDLTKFDTDFDLVSGRYVIDAKSIMGIFSLDLSKPIDLNIHSEGDSGDILSVLAPYLVD